jgi:hypothetical protein
MEVKAKKSNKSESNSGLANTHPSSISEAPTRLNPTPVKGGFRTGTVLQANAQQMIPAQVASRLQAIGQAYGLNLDLSNVALKDVTPDAIKQFRGTVELLTANAKLLPELMKLTQKLMNADIKLAEFHRDLVLKANEHGEKIDKATADIWISMMKAGSKAGKLEHRVNVRTELQQKRDDAYANYQRDSVYGAESAIIEAERRIMASNQQILQQSRTQQIDLNGQAFDARQKRKQELQAYIASAQL